MSETPTRPAQRRSLAASAFTREDEAREPATSNAGPVTGRQLTPRDSVPATLSPLAGQAAQPRRVLRVGELTRYVKRLVENDRLLTGISVIGEVVNLSQPGSGHVYFALKDDAGQLGCVMLRTQAIRQQEEMAALRPGVNAIVEGSLTVYEPRGSYQLLVQRIHIQGAGTARLRFEKLRKQLEGEGLFAEERKRPIPVHPKVLALITAPASQAYHDVIKRLEQQWPGVKVIMAGVTVQGEQAPGEIELALDIVNRMTRAEVILLVRGGGAPEELAAFDDERVGRAIFASRIPVITGLGHTQDWTIADYVADFRATTPTAAAGAAVPDGKVLLNTCRQLHANLRAEVRSAVSGRRRRLAQAEQALLRGSPGNRLAMRRKRLDEVWDGLARRTSGELLVRRRRLEAVRRQMDALNPSNVLARGYALLTDVATGRVITSVEQAEANRRLTARVKDGTFPVRIEAGR